MATDFQKQRFTALIMKSVFLGLMLLALLFSLFIPCMKRTPQEVYGTDYSLTLSVAEEVFGSFAMNAALQSDVDSFVKNGGKDLINLESDKEKYKSASEEQILADVAYKKTLSPSKLKATYDIEAFVTAVNYHMGQGAAEIRKIFTGDAADELIREYYKECRTAVGAAFDLFSYEIERNNYAGLNEFLNTVKHDLSETTFKNAAEKYLLGEYEWNDAFQTKLKTATGATSVMPELQDEFYYLNGELAKATNDAKYGNGYIFQLLFSIAIGILDLVLLIFAILGGVSLYQQFRKQDAPLKDSRKMPFLFVCALLHLIMFLITKEALFVGAFCAGAVVNALFLLLAAAAEIVYDRHLTKMRNKFLRTE